MTYQNGTTGSSTLTFNSVSPTGSLSLLQLGTQAFSTTANPGYATVMLNPPIQIQATTSTGQATAGQFMFMQVVNSICRQNTDNTGQSWYRTTNANFAGYNGPLIDNGKGNAIGYPYQYNGTAGNYSWSLGANASMPATPLTPPYTTDSPYQGTALTNSQVSATDSLSMYLMYQGSFLPGVWIAISEMDWTWSETVTVTGGQWSGSISQQPSPTNKAPSGAAAFPTWVNACQSFIDSVAYLQGS